MLIFAVDRNPSRLAELHDAIAMAAPRANLMDFESADALLAYVKVHGLHPDVVFTELHLGETDGLKLTDRLHLRAPAIKTVFVTEDTTHALEAYRHHVSGYLIKPVTSAAIRAELDALYPMTAAAEKLQIQCFGHFEVFFRGAPVIFRRRQSKELFAFLIDRRGRACTADEIAAALWESESDLPALRQRVRNLISDLRGALRSIGMEDVLIRTHRQIAVNRNLLDCDYYQLLSGSAAAKQTGPYMPEYSWAEFTGGALPGNF